jgi:uncharacterized tellurite resistance protein B-like protein
MKKRTWLTLLVLIVCIGFAVGDAYGRAGGGGGYAGGGGSGSSGGGGGGGGDGIAIYLLVRWWLMICIRYPIVGIPLTVVGLFLFWKFGSKIKLQQQGRTIARGRQVQERGERDAAVARLKSRDPDFDEQRLYERVEKAFRIVQDAWCAQDMSPARAFVSDGIVERFSLQLQEQREKGTRNRLDQLKVSQVRIAQVESDAVFDSMTLRIDASAVDCTVDAKTGKRISGSTMAMPFTEYWTFVRRPGVKSLTGNGLIEGNCPNCGAALSLNETAKCESCGAVVRSGEYDWVLTEITQACEWVAVSSKKVPGVAALQAKDPGFSLRNLEDRASVIFWRYMTALRKQRVEPIRKMALDDFTQGLAEQIKPDANGLVHYFEDCAVGAVETEGLLHGDDYDRAVVAVRWSGSGHGRNPDGKERKESEPHVVYDLFVLVRKHGVKTDIRLALSSAHCPSCGAAVHDEAADACEYCGAVLNDGSAGWVLEKILKVYSPEAAALREAIQSGDPNQVEKRQISSREQVGWMIQVMLADGEIDAREQETLAAFAKKHAIPEQKVNDMVAAMKAGTLQVPQPQSNEEATEWLHTMAEMVLADGKVTASEKQAMLNMGKRLHFSSADINHIIHNARGNLYRQSRESLRASKRSG